MQRQADSRSPVDGGALAPFRIMTHMSCSLDSLKGVMQGTIIGAIKGDTRSLDYSSYSAIPRV